MQQPTPRWRRRSARLWAGILLVAVVVTGVVVHHRLTEDRLAAGRVTTSVAGSADRPMVSGDGIDACQDASDRVFSWVHCGLSMYRAPYVAGLGAAPTGEEWLVVHNALVTRSEHVVVVYDPADQSEGARYVQSGTPSVTLTLNGMTTKPRVSGADQIADDAVRLADRAWLVPEKKNATVRLRYRLPTRLEHPLDGWPKAPRSHEVDVSMTATYPGA